MITAEQILESELWRSIVRDTQQLLTRQFAAIDPADVSSLQNCAYRHQALRTIQLELERRLSDRAKLS
jgi:hypothetical protein